MRTKKRKPKSKKYLNLSLLLIFSFIFCLTFISPADSDWIMYGNDRSIITHSQDLDFYSNFESNSTPDIITSSYGQSFQNDERNQPLVVNVNGEQTLVLVDGAYIRLLDNNLNLQGEIQLNNTPVGMPVIKDFDKDTRQEIMIGERLNASSIRASVFEIDSNFDLVKEDYSVNTLTDTWFEIESFTGFRTIRNTDDNKDYAYSGYTTYNSTDDRSSYIIFEVYYDNGNLEKNEYVIEQNVTGHNPFLEPPSLADTDGDNNPEVLLYTEDKFYLREADFTEWLDVNRSFTGELKYVRIINTIEGLKLFYVLYDSDTYIRLAEYTNGNTEEAISFDSVTDKYRISDIAFDDWTDNGYNDIFMLRSSGDTTEQIFNVYRGRDLEKLEETTTSYQLGLGLEPPGSLTLGKMTEEDNINFIFSDDNYNLIVYDLINNETLYNNSNLGNKKCIPADLSGSGLNDIICSDSENTFLISPEVDSLEGTPSLDNNIPDQYLPQNYEKKLYMDDYFSNYDIIEMTFLTETLRVETGSGDTDTFSNENISLSLVDLGDEIRLDIQTKENDYIIEDINTEAINEVGSVSDNFDIRIDEDYEPEEFSPDEENFLTNAVQDLLNLFPDADNLSSGQKIMIVVFSMIAVTGILIFATATKEGGVSTGIIYLAGFINLMLFVMFITLGYINIGVLIMIFLGLLAIAYFKFRGDN